MSEFFEPDFSEAPEREPAPDGPYTMLVRGNPKLCRSKAGNPYLSWELEHTNPDHKRHGLIFERTVMSGRGAFRLRDIMKAFGYSEADAKTLRVKPMGELTAINAKEGVATDLIVSGQAWAPAGQTIDVTVATEEGQEGGPARNKVARFLAPKDSPTSA